MPLERWLIVSRLGLAVVGWAVEHRRTRLAGDTFVNFPHAAGPVGAFAQVADAGARQDHGADEADGEFANFGPFPIQLCELVLVEIFTVVGGAQVRLRCVKAADGIAEKGNEFLLRAATEAFGHVGHDRFGGIVDLDDEALIFGEGASPRKLEDFCRPFAGALPEHKFGEMSRRGHGERCVEVGGVLGTDYVAITLYRAYWWQTNGDQQTSDEVTGPGTADSAGRRVQSVVMWLPNLRRCPPNGFASAQNSREFLRCESRFCPRFLDQKCAESAQNSTGCSVRISLQARKIPSSPGAHGSSIS